MRRCGTHCVLILPTECGDELFEGVLPHAPVNAAAQNVQGACLDAPMVQHAVLLHVLQQDEIPGTWMVAPHALLQVVEVCVPFQTVAFEDGVRIPFDLRYRSKSERVSQNIDTWLPQLQQNWRGSGV